MLGSVSMSAIILWAGLFSSPAAAAKPGPVMRPSPSQVRTILAQCTSERAAVVASRSEAAATYIDNGVRNAEAQVNAQWLDNRERHLQLKRREIASGVVDAKFVGYDICLQSRWLQFVRAALPQSSQSAAPVSSLQRSGSETPQKNSPVATNNRALNSGPGGGNINDDSDCVSLGRSQTGSVQLVNKCGYALRIRACVVYDDGYTKSRSFDCLNRRSDGSWDLPAHSRTNALLGGGTAYWLICRPPAIPANIVFEQGRGLIGQCR